MDRLAPAMLAIVGGGSKSFLQSATADAELHLSEHCGVIDYQPSELFITARAGTPLAEIEAMLADHKQMLACEPPHFGNEATLGVDFPARVGLLPVACATIFSACACSTAQASCCSLAAR